MYKIINNKISILAFILGFTSIITQIIVLRELITVFYGNEIAFAIILASWLLWVAVGSFLIGVIIKKISDVQFWTVIIQIAIYFVLPITIFTIRALRQITHIPAGEIIDIIPMCISCLFVTAPASLLFGSLYSLLCRYAEAESKTNSSAKEVSGVYLNESMGASIGGLIFSFIFIHFFNAMQMAFILSVINLIVILIAFSLEKKEIKTAALILIITFLGFITGVISKFDKASQNLKWKGFNLVAQADSIYGNLALTKLEDEHSLFQNGLFSFSTRDDLTSEERVHFPLLEHAQPEKVLLIGNGIAGPIKEILKYQPQRVDFIELDPKIIQLSKRFLSKDTVADLDNEKVFIYNIDGRLFVKTTQEKYDVIIVNLGDPYTALINRYYTKEFFKETAKIISDNGILSLSVSSSENYLSEENRDYLRSLNSTLKSVFAQVKSIPGDTNIFLAAKAKEILTVNHNILTARLKERGIETKFINENYLPFKLSGDRMFYIEEVLSKKGEVNTDLKPISYFYDMVLWSTRFNQSFKSFIERFKGLTIFHLALFPVLLFSLGLLFIKKNPNLPVMLSIAATGFSEIIFQIIVIIAFQSLYGYAYYKVGFIVTSFMLGLCLGTFSARKILEKNEDESKISHIYKKTQLAIVIYPLILPVLFVVFRDVFISRTIMGLFASLFALLPIIAGFIGGLQYPLAIRLLKKDNDNISTAQSAGFLYAIDVFGAALGALITGVLLIPILGITQVAIFCAILNGAVFALFLKR